MTITQRQFNHLNEIGIKVWQKRSNQQTVQTSNNTTNPKAFAAPLAIDSTLLTQNNTFIDVLLSIDVSLGELTIENNVINLGLFNWQFIEKDEISFSKSTLYTPPISTIEKQFTLKKELWNIIQREVLV